MKLKWVCTVAVVAAGISGMPGAALSADMPVKAVPALPAPVDWTGFYVGGTIGHAWGSSDPSVTYNADPTTNVVPAAMPGLSSSSLTGGVQAGHNWQIGRWVLGGEADFNWLNAKADSFIPQFWVTSLNVNTLTLSSRYDWLATARLRAGVLVTPDLMVYATGGLAVTRVEDSAAHTFPAFPSTASWSERRTLFGGAIGGGFEYAFSPRWTVKGEYLHATFNDVLPQWQASGTVAGSYAAFAHRLDIARLGVNYRWNASGTTPAGVATTSGRWTGLYAGLHAGYVRGRSDPFWTNDAIAGCPFTCPTGLPDLRSAGFIGGGQAGYNWQAGRWVAGGEIDFSGLSAKSETTVAPLYTGDALLIGTSNSQVFSSHYNWLATARLRQGYLLAPDWLLYATGGLAVASVKDSAVYASSVTPETTSAQTKVLYGATIGAGLEYAVSNAWSVKLEYLHAVLNRTAPETNAAVTGPPNFGFKHSLDIARIGINRKLN